MQRVYIISPLNGDVDNNIRKALEYGSEVLDEGNKVPVIVHAVFPSFLNDNDINDRKFAIRAGLQLITTCDYCLVCTKEISEGMNGEISYANAIGIDVRYKYDAVQTEKHMPKDITPLNRDEWQNLSDKVKNAATKPPIKLTTYEEKRAYMASVYSILECIEEWIEPEIDY